MDPDPPESEAVEVVVTQEFRHRFINFETFDPLTAEEKNVVSKPCKRISAMYPILAEAARCVCHCKFTQASNLHFAM